MAKQPLSVLVIERDDASALIVAEYLAEYGATPVRVVDNKGAFDALASARGAPSLILLTIPYNACSQVTELVAEIRRVEASQHASPRPIVALSTLSAAEFETTFCDTRFAGYLQLPFTEEEFETVLDPLLDPAGEVSRRRALLKFAKSLDDTDDLYPTIH